jgi:hypothetical protein
MTVMSQSDLTCPNGHNAVVSDLTCHTWPKNGQYMTCLRCDTAMRYFCMTEGCNWEFIHGLNRNNPRAAVNEEQRPEWLPDDGTTGRHDRDYITVAGAVPYWDWDE